MQPYCNVISVTVAQRGSLYRVDGTDDQCGAARVAAVLGLAFPNPNGSIGFGLTTVLTPGGASVHIDATVDLPGLSGTWRDSVGNSGAFTFTTGAGSGPLRPGPPVVQSRVTAQCSTGSSIRAINADGSVVCETHASAGGDITSVNTPAGGGLTGGAISGDATLSLQTGGVQTVHLAADAVTMAKTSAPVGGSSVSTAIDAGQTNHIVYVAQTIVPDSDGVCVVGASLHAATGTQSPGQLALRVAVRDNAVDTVTTADFGGSLPLAAFNQGFINLGTIAPNNHNYLDAVTSVPLSQGRSYQFGCVVRRTNESLTSGAYTCQTHYVCQ